MESDECSVFVSHAAVDEEIATCLKKYVEAAFPGRQVFVSSDPEDLSLGDDWVVKILRALETAKFVLVLATKRGLSRKWVWFEAGRTWFSGLTMLPCCIGSVRKSGLPSPFSGRMGANLDESHDVRLLFDCLSKSFGASAVALDFDEMARTMARLDVRAEERQKIFEDPFVAEKMRAIDRTIRNLSPAERETIRQFVIYGELSTSAARSLVMNSGVDMNKWSVPEHLVKVTAWLNPKAGNQPYDDQQMNVYVINSEMRAVLQDYFLRESES
jgi:hypothetical protein